MKVVPAILGTMTGMATNLDAEVLDASGNAISGLYAAGEAANENFTIHCIQQVVLLSR